MTHISDEQTYYDLEYYFTIYQKKQKSNRLWEDKKDYGYSDIFHVWVCDCIKQGSSFSFKKRGCLICLYRVIL